MPESFLDGRVVLHCGDMREALAVLPENSFDACVTDPPYHLLSIVKRFGSPDSAPINNADEKTGRWGPYHRASKGFMGKEWDGGDLAFDAATWATVLRVLKPGAHAVVFTIPKHVGFVQVAMQQAGFEFRDIIVWAFGSGFPKSHSMSKHIDRMAGAEREVLGMRKVEDIRGDAWGSGNGKRDDGRERLMDYAITAPASDDARTWDGWGTALKPAVELIVLARKPLSEGSVAANVLKWGTGAININATRIAVSDDSYAANCSGDRGHADNRSRDMDFAMGCGRSSDIGRWPANFAHDGSEEVKDLFPDTGISAGGRIGNAGGGDVQNIPVGLFEPGDPGYGDQGSAARFFFEAKPDARGGDERGRWPANLAHDGSEAVLAAFPETDQPGGWPRVKGEQSSVYGEFAGTSKAPEYYADSGSAARFFYTAKADADDRLGSRHPTVKPLDLMQWLCRLVCRKGGRVLDPFAGTGTTAEAAWREGMRCELVEREDEYCNDIRRRMGLVLAGPEERARAAIKAKNLPRDDGPLFEWGDAQ